MNVLFYYDKLPLRLGGAPSAPRQLATVAAELSAARPDWKITVACPGSTDIQGVTHIPLSGNTFHQKIELLKRKILLRFNVHYSPKGSGSIAGLKGTHQPDVVVLVRYGDIIPFKQQWKETRIIYWPLSTFNYGHEFEYTRALEKADLVIFHRPLFYQDLLNRLAYYAFPAPVKMVSAVSSALAEMHHQPDNAAIAAFKSQLNIKAGDKILIYAGGANQLKGRKVIELALANKIFTNKNGVLISTGNAQQKERLLPNGIRIIHLGLLDDARYRIAVHAADLALVATMGHEPGPAITPEYMAAGKAIIATAMGGNRHFLNNQNAWLIKAPNDIAEWSKAIAEAMDREPMRQTKAAQALADYKSWPDVSVWGQEWAEAIEQLAAAKE